MQEKTNMEVNGKIIICMVMAYVIKLIGTNIKANEMIIKRMEEAYIIKLMEARTYLKYTNNFKLILF